MTKIMLVTASFGDGHRQVAAALEEQFNSRGAETFIIDCFRATSPRLSRFNEWIYESSTRYTPLLYGASYRGTQKLGPRNWLWKALALFSKKSALKAIAEYQPDAVLQLFPDHMLSRLNSATRPIVGVVLTDYSIHGRWFHPNVDLYFLPDRRLNESAARFAGSAQKVAAGIPVRNLARTKASSFAPQSPYVLFATGGRGVFSDLENTIRLVKGYFPQHHVYVMCGRNEKMRESILRWSAGISGVYPLPFVENVGEWMSHAEFAVVKSGGITVTECLVSACPMLVYRPQPGQETDNAKFVVQVGAGVEAVGEKTLRKALRQFQITAVRQAMAQACRQTARPDAAGRVAETVLEEIKKRQGRG